MDSDQLCETSPVSTSSFRSWLALSCAALLLSACGADRDQPASVSTPVPTAPVVAAIQSAPAITSQPLSTAVSAGGSATFSVAANGDALTYQWQRNGAPVPDATGPSYTTPAVSTTDSGAHFSVVVKNADGQVASQMVTLTVTESGLAN